MCCELLSHLAHLCLKLRQNGALLPLLLEQHLANHKDTLFKACCARCFLRSTQQELRDLDSLLDFVVQVFDCDLLLLLKLHVKFERRGHRFTVLESVNKLLNFVSVFRCLMDLPVQPVDSLADLDSKLVVAQDLSAAGLHVRPERVLDLLDGGNLCVDLRENCLVLGDQVLDFIGFVL